MTFSRFSTTSFVSADEIPSFLLPDIAIRGTAIRGHCVRARTGCPVESRMTIRRPPHGQCQEEWKKNLFFCFVLLVHKSRPLLRDPLKTVTHRVYSLRRLRGSCTFIFELFFTVFTDELFQSKIFDSWRSLNGSNLLCLHTPFRNLNGVVGLSWIELAAFTSERWTNVGYQYWIETLKFSTVKESKKLPIIPSCVSGHLYEFNSGDSFEWFFLLNLIETNRKMISFLEINKIYAKKSRLYYI